MNWDALRFDWSKARAFLATAEEGSFSGAARALGMAQPTIGRQVEALEQELDVLLFERIGKRLVLTPSGAALLEHVRVMGEAATKVSLTASGQAQSLEGPIRISASAAVCSCLLPPVLAALQEEHPGIEVTLLATGSISDLQMREADIAIRNVPPKTPDLIARRTPDRVGGFYASDAYLARAGVPKTLDALRRARFIGFEGAAHMANSLKAFGVDLEAQNFKWLSEDHLVQWALVKAGLGIGIMMTDLGDAEPGVHRVWPEFEVPFPMWLLAHRELRTSRRVRVVYDRLAEALSQRVL